jgi:very-short-patch-repair endonuclease
MNDTARRHLLRQAGVISRRQALKSGLTSRQIDRLLQNREWLRAWPGVYRLHASVPTPETALRAASLWLGPAALLIDHGAAWWWGVASDPPATWTFAACHRRRLHSSVRVVEAFVDPRDQTVRRGVPVVSKPWAVLRTAAVWEQRSPGGGITLIDRAKQTHAVRHEELHQAFDRHPGCWGSSTIRTLLRRTGDGAHSELERLAIAALKQAGITGFQPNLTVRLSNGQAVEIDIAFVDRRIAIELDGFAYHSDADSFRYDRRRGNKLMADGWTVRRFTFDDLLADPDGFIATVLELLSV